MAVSVVPGWLALAGLACLTISALFLLGLLATLLHTLTHRGRPKEPT